MRYTSQKKVREAVERGELMPEEGEYLKALIRINYILKDKPPSQWSEKRFIYAQALAKIIINRLKNFIETKGGKPLTPNRPMVKKGETHE